MSTLADAGDALAPVIGYDKASKIAHYAIDHDLTLKEAALKLEYVTEAEFDKVVDPSKMVHHPLRRNGVGNRPCSRILSSSLERGRQRS